MLNLQRALSWRNAAGKACMLFCLLASLAVLDGVVAKFLEPTNVFHVLAGESVEANGPLPENIKRTDELQYASDSPQLRLAFDAIHAGYFLGGNMWRGRILTGETLAPGKYTISIRPKDYPPEKPGYQIRVVVHPDQLSQRTGFASIIKRQTGRSPYLVALACLPLIGLTLGVVFFLSRRIDELEAASGMAEIYHVAKQEGLYRVTFGLGLRHGVHVGDQVTLLDPDGQYVGAGQVVEASENDAAAVVAIDQIIRPGYFISRN